MSSRVRKLWAVFAFDFEATLGYGFLEAVAAFMLYISVTLTNNLIAAGHLRVEIPPNPPWSGVYEDYVTHIADAAIRVYCTSTTGLASALAFVLPIVVMFSIAKGFEDGFLQTQLSYPIGRSKLLLTKVVSTVCIFGALSSISIHLAVSILSPGSLQIGSMFLVAGALWAFLVLVITSTTLLALAIKRPLFGTLVGVSLWLGIGVMGVLPDILQPLENVLNPLIPVNEFVNSYSTTTLLFGNLVLYVVGTIALALSLLMISVVYFNQLDV
ncbi:MAG: hypothetical protein EAX95_04020 [Candidatus Thorarchaeota archaeon]|nr:hypothetical protein [Candidatus Thorarchaeota archaeon]